MKKAISILLLEKYINGECTPEECEEVKKWYDSFENDDDFISALSSSELDRMEKHLYANILAKAGPSQPLQKEENKRHLFRSLSPVYRYAAAIAAVFLIIFGINALDNTLKHEAVSTNGHSLNVVINHTQTLYRYVLPDSTQVWLSPQAKLKFPSSFSKSERKVFMEGECFFDVTKDTRRPFTIHSKHLITKVWGTSFRVRDLTNKVDVSVLTGKVSVGLKKYSSLQQDNSGDTVLLLPNQKVTYLALKESLKPAVETDRKSMAIWKKTSLFFNNSSLSTVASTLSEKFDVDIQLAGKELHGYTLTADMNDFNLPEVLEVLKKSLGTDYEIQSNKIILSKSN